MFSRRSVSLTVLLLVLAAARGSELLPLTVADGQLAVEKEDGSTEPIQLRGVTAVGANFHCIQNYSIFDGPTDESYFAGLKTWSIRVVRVCLNEDCLLGINGVNPSFSGEKYQAAVTSYIQNLTFHGFYVIVTVHWTAPGSEKATGQQPMPDRDHTVAFWKTLATKLKGNRAVIFDLFNEPYPDDNTIDSASAWKCWRDGGWACRGLKYLAAGMQSLVTTVRQVGAPNVLMLGGINYANSLTRWVEYAPADPLHRLAASWHSYSINHCNQEACWESTIAPVAKHYPVIAGEIGEKDCAGVYITPLMNWMDAHNSSYLAWVWMPWDCIKGPSLITGFDGGCTDSYGCTYRNHLLGSSHSPKVRSNV